MLLEIISPDKELFSGEVDRVLVPGSKGPFMILRNHAPIISTLEAGRIRITGPKGDNTFFEVDGGVIEVKNDKIIVLAENTK